MKSKSPAQTVFTWLRNNLEPHALDALTHHDAAALQAAVQIAGLWLRGDAEHRKKSALAFNQVVTQMQPQTQWLAFHATAHVGDWCHRDQLWWEAYLAEARLTGRPECKFGPGRNPDNPLRSNISPSKPGPAPADSAGVGP